MPASSNAPAGKRRQHRGAESLRRRHVAHDLSHRRHLRHRQRRIDCGDGGADRRRERGRIDIAVDGNVHVAPQPAERARQSAIGRFRVRRVDMNYRIAAERAIDDVTRHADDRLPGRRRRRDEPHFSRLPIGSCPGQYRSARFLLTITTRRLANCSSVVKLRPRMSGMPNVEK